MKRPPKEALACHGHLERDGPDDYAIVFPDVPEAVTGGRTPEEAWKQAPDALAVALTSYPTLRLPLPHPSPPRKGDRLIAVPATDAAKLFIRQALSTRQMSAADLARLLGTDHKTVRRILSLGHRTRMAQLETVLEKLGITVALLSA